MKGECVMNSYQGATKNRRYLMTKWADVIRDRGGDEPDEPTVYGKAKWAEIGLGGADGSAIVWEGFYDWTRPREIEKMKSLLAGTGLYVYDTAEWMVEICD